MVDNSKTQTTLGAKLKAAQMMFDALSPFCPRLKDGFMQLATSDDIMRATEARVAWREATGQ
jgi:hypothetical protein